jgi:histidine triad (HIT) family protein
MMVDSNCLFCKIVAGEIPAVKVLEDDVCIAFMDIGPIADGHVLLIPKFHAATLDELPAEQAGDMLKHLPALVRAVKTATSCQGVNVLQNNGPVAHQEIMHVHFHVIGRNEGDAFDFNWPAGSYGPGRIEELAEAIKEQL